MWVVIAAFAICLLVTYTVRRMSIDHSWKIALLVGALLNILIIGGGDMILDVGASYLELIGGNVAAIVIGLVLEFLFFSVDYSRSESMQFEDDEYYYYVKAVPKMSVTTRKKQIKKINAKKDDRRNERY